MVMYTHVRRAEMLVLYRFGSALPTLRAAHGVDSLAKCDGLSAAVSSRVSCLEGRQAHVLASLRAASDQLVASSWGLVSRFHSQLLVLLIIVVVDKDTNLAGVAPFVDVL